jgi:hypothetical protein
MDALIRPIKEAIVGLLIALAAYAAGYATHALTAKAKATAKAAAQQVQAVQAAVTHADRAEVKIIKVTSAVEGAAQEAHHAIAVAPHPTPSPSCDYGPVLDAWRSGVERVRAASSAGDGPADGAPAVPVAGPGESSDGG